MNSERKIIREMCRGIPRAPHIPVPAGLDDAAVVRAGDMHLAVTSDIMFESSHFPKRLLPEQAGRKAVVANISDLASMGAKPLYLVISLGIPKAYAGLPGLVRGIKQASSEYGAIIIGGDTKCSRELTVSICAIGEMGGKPLTRNNARPGDIVAVTGIIGSAFCGLHSLLSATSSPEKLIQSFSNPKARVKEGLALSRLSARVAAMDITDGLLYTASEIACASKVRIEIEKSRIPVSRLALAYSKKHDIPFSALVNTGEDYELLVCISKKDFEIAKGKANLTKIGRVLKGSGVYLDKKRTTETGYDAFFGL